MSLATSDIAVQPPVKVALLTGGMDRPYVFGIATALASKGVHVDIIGSDVVDRPELHAPPALNFLNLRGDQSSNVSMRKKVTRVLLYYARLLRYAWTTDARMFHLLWNNKFEYFDRTLLMAYYKLLGKKVAFTAHNVNAGKRDGKDSALNRLTLKMQYRLADHIFVHTENMKRELLADFRIPADKVTVIPFGINNSVPTTELTTTQAKECLQLPRRGGRTILFFGAIRPYKGLEYVVDAFQRIALKHEGYRLIIAGDATDKEAKQYLSAVQERIAAHASRDQVIQHIGYVPDSETELYFKAADVLALPYTVVFQSGVLFLSYSFGLPAIASDVGSFKEDIVAGGTGFVCRACDPADLATTIETYFDGELFRTLEDRRKGIQEFAEKRHSWSVVGDMTKKVYAQLVGEIGNETFSLDSDSCVQRAGMDR